MIPDAYPDRRRWQELKEACREAANYQCQYVYPNNKRCTMRHGQLHMSKLGRKYILYLHACHVNDDPGNEHPELLCLCPKHHMMLDRRKEMRERMSQRRRGYQITTTDLLLHEVNAAGITVTEQSDGYTWSIDGQGLSGTRTTAIEAVGTAIHQMRCLIISQQATIAHLSAKPTEI